jgi:hypothetical protein
MKVLAIPQPVANDVMLGQQSLIALPFGPGDVTEFLMVSEKDPMPDEYSLGLARGVALGTVQINAAKDSVEVDGFYEWEVVPTSLVAPVAMDAPVDGFADVDEEAFIKRNEATIGLFAWLAEPHADFGLALQAHADELIAIGTKQMPLKYQEILARTGSWDEVDAAWQDEQFEHRNAHMVDIGFGPEIGHMMHHDMPDFKLHARHNSE